MILLTLFAFISGLVTILAPCIWPLLPIVLSSSISGKGQRHSFGIALGITLSFAIFTLTLSSLVRSFHFDPNLLRIFAVLVLVVLGLSMIIPRFSIILESAVSKLSSKFKISPFSGSGFWGGFITGVSLGIIWSPCAGPILAAITTLAATGVLTFDVVVITLSYSLGVGIPLFLFANYGAKLFKKSKKISPYTGTVQKFFGVLMLLTALAIYTNYDKVIEVNLLNALPLISSNLTAFETTSPVSSRLAQLTGKKSIQQTSGLPVLGKAPDFSGGTNWLNTKEPLTLSDLKGKVVLVDFWTYTCINCIRTLPHISAWYNKYSKSGFVVIGVHTPEFEFEHDTSNVLSAIKMFNIKYPVVQDNNYAIWNAYSNEYWPAEYLIDAQGNLRNAHFGEGDYDSSEKDIQELLKESDKNISNSLTKISDQTPQGNLSPETYLGSNRMQFYYPNGSISNGTQNFNLQDKIPQDSFSLGGNWIISNEFATALSNAALNYNFNANKVFLVLSPTSTSDQVKVFLDGKLVDFSNEGADVSNGTLNINSQRLYNLIDLKGKSGSHLLKLEFETPGTQVFAFTFG